jgi:ribosomal protein S18 acetylase RimI-like enzyme
MKISQRAATLEDIEWLEPFYESIMRPYYVELNLIWDDTKFREYFDPQSTKIIQADGIDIGLLQVQDRADCIYICDIQLDREYRNKGIGTSLIESVIRSAIVANKPVRLRVLRGNSAKKLYIRLGFKEVETFDDCDILERA